MRLAFVTAAIGAGVAAATVTTLVIWIATVLLDSSGPWSVAPLLVAAAAVAFAVATYIGERIAHRRTLASRRAAGEPWAFRGER